MQGNKFVVSFSRPGTLAANAAGSFALPFAFTILAVMAGGSGANDGKLEIGTIADPNAYLTSAAIGDSGTPAKFEKGDWDGVLFTGIDGVDPIRIAADTPVTWALDFDGAAGTATANFELQFVCVEG